MGKRSLRIQQIKKARKDKKVIKRPFVVFQEDLGKVYRRQILSLPEEAELEEVLIPKEKQNPNTFYIIRSPIMIVGYLDSGKCFVYSVFGKFLGTLEKSDQKKLFSKLGAFLRTKRSRKAINIIDDSKSLYGDKSYE